MSREAAERLSPLYPFKNKLVRFFVRLFDQLCFAARTFFFQKDIPDERINLESSQKILAIRLDHLGDIVLTRPALYQLRTHYPAARIDLLVSSEWAPLMTGAPEIDRVIPFISSWFSRKKSIFRMIREAYLLLGTIRREHYALAIDFRGDLRNIIFSRLAGIRNVLGYGNAGGGGLLSVPKNRVPSEHQAVSALKLLQPLGVFGDISTPAFHAEDESRLKLFQRHPELNPSEPPKILIHPRAGYSSKIWPPENFAELINLILRETEFSVFLLGTAEELTLFQYESNPRLFDLRGKIRLEELPAVFDAADYYIGGDSGPAHLAAAQNIPGTILFSGVNDVRVWRPLSENLQIVTHPVACSPCESQHCPLKHHDCMKKISVQSVWCGVKPRLIRKLKDRNAR